MRSLLLLLALAFLAGCETVNYRSAKLINPHHGGVAVRVIYNNLPPEVAYVHPGMPRFYNRLDIERLPDEHANRVIPYSIAATRGNTSHSTTHSTLFAAGLPPGRYRIARLAYTCAAPCYLESVTPSDKFSHFEVARNTLTDLGSISVTSLAPQYQGSFLARQKNVDVDITQEIIREIFPGLSALLERPLISWPNGYDDVQEYIYQHAIRHSAGTTAPTQTPDGEILTGSYNGVVFRRNLDAPPRPYNTGVRVALETVLTTTDNLWLAGGELSTLMLSRDQGESWSSVRGDLPLGIIQSLHEWQGEVFVTLQHNADVFIYRAKPQDFAWTLLTQYKLERGFFSPSLLSPRSYLHANQLLTVLPDRKLAVYNLAENNLELREVPGQVNAFWQWHDGTILVFSESGLVSRNLISYDLGLTWGMIETDQAHTAVVLADNRREGAALLPRPNSQTRLLYTDDSGETWHTSTDVHSRYAYLFYGHDQQTLYAINRAGRLIASQDHGKSWRGLR